MPQEFEGAYYSGKNGIDTPILLLSDTQAQELGQRYHYLNPCELHTRQGEPTRGDLFVSGVIANHARISGNSRRREDQALLELLGDPDDAWVRFTPQDGYHVHWDGGDRIDRGRSLDHLEEDRSSLGEDLYDAIRDSLDARSTRAQRFDTGRGRLVNDPDGHLINLDARYMVMDDRLVRPDNLPWQERTVATISSSSGGASHRTKGKDIATHAAVGLASVIVAEAVGALFFAADPEVEKQAAKKWVGTATAAVGAGMLLRKGGKYKAQMPPLVAAGTSTLPDIKDFRDKRRIESYPQGDPNRQRVRNVLALEQRSPEPPPIARQITYVAQPAPYVIQQPDLAEQTQALTIEEAPQPSSSQQPLYDASIPTQAGSVIGDYSNVGDVSAWDTQNNPGYALTDQTAGNQPQWNANIGWNPNTTGYAQAGQTGGWDPATAWNQTGGHPVPQQTGPLDWSEYYTVRPSDDRDSDDVDRRGAEAQSQASVAETYAAQDDQQQELRYGSRRHDSEDDKQDFQEQPSSHERRHAGRQPQDASYSGRRYSSGEQAPQEPKPGRYGKQRASQSRDEASFQSRDDRYGGGKQGGSSRDR